MRAGWRQAPINQKREQFFAQKLTFPFGAVECRTFNDFSVLVKFPLDNPSFQSCVISEPIFLN